MLRQTLLCLLACCISLPAWALSVVFINPGKSDEIYWVTASRAMEAAAKSLKIDLEILYAQRQHPRVIEFAEHIIARPAAKRPDFVVFSNDYGTGPELVRMFDEAGIKVFLAFSAFTGNDDRAAMGRPRATYQHWLGSLEPRADEAGYHTAKALITAGRAARLHGKDGKLHLLAIAGDRSTPSSLRRNEGMRRAVAESGDVVLDQEVYGGWSREKAAEQSEWLYQRHPRARLIWAGNDLMAFGAMDVWEKRGGKPGKDALFSGINTSSEALAALRNGRLSALSGGHFIAGAWSLVMLHDYAHGRDFAQDEGSELDVPMFALFNARTAALFEQRYGSLNFDSVDFRRYSKVLNPKLKRYDFSFSQLLR
mgnify:CR=1 FL=1